jgi:hypothetical protein
MDRRLLTGLALALAGCAGSGAPDGPVSQSPGGQPGSGNPTTSVIPLARFRPDSQAYSPVSGYHQAERLVVTDQATWQSVWHTVHATLAPEPPLAAVDFSREVVLVAAMGRQPSGGYAVRLEAAQQDDQAVTVTVRTVVPGAGCVVPQVVTSPVDLARLPRTALPVRFADRSDTLRCE